MPERYNWQVEKLQEREAGEDKDDAKKATAE